MTSQAPIRLNRYLLMARTLDKLLARLGPRRRRERLLVVVQTERGQVAVPAQALRDRLRAR